MRVAIVAESFLPHMNGVTGSVLRVVDHLVGHGHEAVVVAAGHGAPAEYHGAPTLHVPSVGLPGYPQVRVSTASQRRLASLLRATAPDVVHLASPLMLGNTAVRAAWALRLPTVAVFQTDVAGFAERYGHARWSERIWDRTVELHTLADRTLAPSASAVRSLRERRVPRVHRWGRGVDAERFDPRRRSAALRSRWAPGGEVLVGFLGRLAPEKELGDLAAIDDLPGVRLVFVGDGPSRAGLQRQFPRARFTGHLDGDELGAAVASLDLMVHPGANETFCQSVQESLAAGVPVVAPAVGGPAELVAPSHTGWLYPPGDLGALRSAVCDLVGDAAKRRAFGRAARAAVRGRTWEAVCAELVAHYAAVISGDQLHDDELAGDRTE